MTRGCHNNRTKETDDAAGEEEDDDGGGGGDAITISRCVLLGALECVVVLIVGPACGSVE